MQVGSLDEPAISSNCGELLRATDYRGRLVTACAAVWVTPLRMVKTSVDWTIRHQASIFLHIEEGSQTVRREAMKA
jgi:hypothetical protein